MILTAYIQGSPNEEFTNSPRSPYFPSPFPSPPRVPSEPPEVPSPPAVSTRGGRRVRLSGWYEDFLPSSRTTRLSQWGAAFAEPPRAPTPSNDTAARDSAPSNSEAAPDAQAQPGPSDVEGPWFTDEDAFGLYRKFSRPPARDPETRFSLDAVCDAPGLETAEEDIPPEFLSLAWLTGTANNSRPEDRTAEEPQLGPFGTNTTQFRMYDWLNAGPLSNSRFNDLIDITNPKNGFKAEDLERFTAEKGDRLLDEWMDEPQATVFTRQHGWHESSVILPMPSVGADFASEDDAPQFAVKGVHHRKLLDLLIGAVSDKSSRFAHDYHWIPNKMYWYPPDTAEPSEAFGSRSSRPTTPSSPSESSSAASSRSRSRARSTNSPTSSRPSSRSSSSTPSSAPLRVLTDCYNSDAMLEEDAKIRKLPRVEGDDPSVEYAVLPILLWSDETVLSNFGTAALWPIYLYLGNLSKYVRGRPTEFAAHHLAYIPNVSEGIHALVRYI